MKSNDTGRSWMAVATRTARFGLCLMALLLPAFASSVQAQIDEGFERARDTYNAGEYDQAAEQFAVLAKDETVDLEIRKESLRYLGRAHLAQGHSDGSPGLRFHLSLSRLGVQANAAAQRRRPRNADVLFRAPADRAGAYRGWQPHFGHHPDQ